MGRGIPEILRVVPQPWANTDTTALAQGWDLRAHPTVSRLGLTISDPIFDLCPPPPAPTLLEANLKFLLKVRSLPSVFLIFTLENTPPHPHQVKKGRAGEDSGGGEGEARRSRSSIQARVWGGHWRISRWY